MPSCKLTPLWRWRLRLLAGVCVLLAGLAPHAAKATPWEVELEWLGGADLGATTSVREHQAPNVYQVDATGRGPATRLGIDVRPFAAASRLGWLGFTAAAWGAARPSELDKLAGETAPRPFKRTLWSWSGRVAARGRLEPLPWLSVAGELGYATVGHVLPTPTEASTADALDFRNTPFAAHGPSLGAWAQARHGPLTARLGAAIVPWSWGAIARQTARALPWDASATVAYELPALASWRLSLRAQYLLQSVGGTPRDAELTGFLARSHFLALGVGAHRVTPPLTVPRLGTLRGRVLLPDGSPAVGAQVSVDGVTLAVAADGRFERPPPGVSAPPSATEAPASALVAPPLELAVRLDGFLPLTRTLTWDAVALAEAVELVLARAEGPGRIRGTVRARADGAPIAGAEIATSAGPVVVSDAAGAFLIPSAGPGPVPLKVSFKGFKADEPVVSVAPATEAVVDVVLDRAEQLPPAVLRGLIRSASKRPIAAKVRIVDLPTAVKVQPDGRFVVEVPPGTWSLVISAPGHVTQTKSVELNEGDQALFHCDLQPVAR